MARFARPSLVWFFVAFAATAGACATNNDPPANDLECQIQAEGEKSPGYPFSLAKYRDELLPVLTASCGAGCHAAPANLGNFQFWADAAEGNCNYAKTFNSVKARVDLANPANSSLVAAVNGGIPNHPVTYQDGDPNLAAIQGYIDDAAATYAAGGGGGGAPPPGASPFDYDVYQATIQLAMNAAGCAQSQCHGATPGPRNVHFNPAPAPASAEMEANFITVTTRANLTTPSSSVIYRQATTAHGGGSVPMPAAAAAALLAWIEDAKANSGGGGNVACAPIDRFNLGVFANEIFPIFTGDIDYNEADQQGQGASCSSGACHGVSRGPASLVLSETADAATNLQNFACFVDLLSPSSSQVLACPLDQANCRVGNHPGQDVFQDANDLNYQKVLAFLFGGSAAGSPIDFAFFVRRINTMFSDINAVQDGDQGLTCGSAGCHANFNSGGADFVLASGTDPATLAFNFTQAASFINFLNPEGSSLFLYPTDEIANVDNDFATGLPHPGDECFDVADQEALDILRWAGGLRTNDEGFIQDFLVAGDYPAANIDQDTFIVETQVQPKIFDPTGVQQFNAGQWDGLFSNVAEVDLNAVFPRVGVDRIVYAQVYLINITGDEIDVNLTVNSTDNDVRIYIDNALRGQGVDVANGFTTLPADGSPTPILIKFFQQAADAELKFTALLVDEDNNTLEDDVVLVLGPEGGI